MKLVQEYNQPKVKVIIKSKGQDTESFKLVDTTFEEVVSMVSRVINGLNLSPIKSGFVTSVEIIDEDEKGKRIQSTTISFYNYSVRSTCNELLANIQ